MSPAQPNRPLSNPEGGHFASGAGGLCSRRTVSSACLLFLVLWLGGCGRRDIVRPTPQMDIESQFWVRVLLESNAAECTVEVPSRFHLHKAEFDPAIPAGGSLMEATPGEVSVSLVGGRLMLGGTAVPENELVISPASPHVFRLNGDDYRGRLKLAVDRDGRTFDAINLVPLEPYLAGVVGAEMPSYWEPAALRAQTIAARTYCLFIKNRFGVNRHYDVSQTQASQVYGGIGAESAQVWDAVSSTHGKVLVTKERPPASQWSSEMLSRGVFPAYYSSICGGHTADSEDVFGDSFSTLRGAPCPHCKDVAKLGLFFWPMVQMDRLTVTSQLAARYPKLKRLGTIREISADGHTDHGRFSRLTRIKLVGQTGKTDTLRAEDLRLSLDPSGRRIRSTICQVVPWNDGWAFLAGRGWGHGVGLCQHGAQGMARLGVGTEEILQHYYPGAEIVNVY